MQFSTMCSGMNQKNSENFYCMCNKDTHAHTPQLFLFVFIDAISAFPLLVVRCPLVKLRNALSVFQITEQAIILLFLTTSVLIGALVMVLGDTGSNGRQHQPWVLDMGEIDK